VVRQDRGNRGKRSPEPGLIRLEQALTQIQIYAQAGKVVGAVRLADRALATSKGLVSAEATLLRARIQTNLASSLVDVGQVARALQLLDEALDAAPGQAQAIFTARGFIRLRTGETELALADLTTAIEGPRLADGRAHFAALLNRGLLNMDRGRLSEAEQDTRAAVAVAVSTGQPDNEFMARHNLAYLKFLYGDLPSALAEMQSAENTLSAGYVGVPALDRARVLQAAGLFVEAAEFTARAVDEFRHNKAGTDLADALLLSAELDMHFGQTRGARNKAHRAETLRAQQSNPSAALVARLTNLRARPTEVSPGRTRAVLRRYAEEAVQIGEQLSDAGLIDDSATALLLAAQSYLGADDVERARPLVDAVWHAGGRPSLPTRLRARYVTGRIALADGDRLKGLAELRKGLDDLEDFQSRFGSQDLQSGAAIHGSLLTKLGLRTAIETGSPATILQWLERGRAVSTRLPAVHPPADPELAELLGALRYATTQARQAALGGGPAAALERQVTELRKQVRARSWIVSGSGAATRPLSLAAVRRLLAGDPDDPTVVAFITGLDAVRALVITAKGAWFRLLGDWDDEASRHRRRAADLDMLAAPRVSGPLRRVALKSVTDELQRLSEQLLDPIASRFAGGPVLIAAVGELATVPWNLLTALRGRPVSVASSVTAAMVASGRPARAHLRGVLAVAGPEVPHGAKEAERVVDEQATGEAVLAQLPSGGLLHVAAHGHHETESALFSSVLLADGPLYGYDIAPNSHLPDHVVLSSCDVGRSHLRPGGEPLGLAAALLRSGVSTVVAGVSRVSDSVALEVMVGYHERLVAGDSPAAALASAVGSVDGELAAFNCFGSGN
jgi:tetratricopeptide (TPR) repeat protein